MKQFRPKCFLSVGDQSRHLKWLFTEKYIPSSFTRSHVVPNLCDIIFSIEHKRKLLINHTVCHSFAYSENEVTLRWVEVVVAHKCTLLQLLWKTRQAVDKMRINGNKKINNLSEPGVAQNNLTKEQSYIK